jgi:hypothetical protein
VSERLGQLYHHHLMQSLQIYSRRRRLRRAFWTNPAFDIVNHELWLTRKAGLTKGLGDFIHHFDAIFKSTAGVGTSGGRF